MWISWRKATSVSNEARRLGDSGLGQSSTGVVSLSGWKNMGTRRRRLVVFEGVSYEAFVLVIPGAKASGPCHPRDASPRFKAWAAWCLGPCSERARWRKVGRHCGPRVRQFPEETSRSTSAVVCWTRTMRMHFSVYAPPPPRPARRSGGGESPARRLSTKIWPSSGGSIGS